MKGIRFVTPARREFISEVAYYAAKGIGLAARFAAAIEETVTRAAVFPLSGFLASGRTRRAFVKGFLFAIVYCPDVAAIVIFVLAHHSRRPEYWHNRVQER